MRPIQRLVVDYIKEGSTTNPPHNAPVQQFGSNIIAHNAPLPNNFGTPTGLNQLSGKNLNF